ncbi:hypothetical protein EUBVEN_02087 [Eubacterium ventriosum ATCC 27560]|uniref:Uncharacterized protein n=1 Tax=Eubacterium ventriosum ATCC 27560 TaxID=411463 RepID=A5Z8P6_9FIRM|nr:hypothetical protein EUBVEN_02087 [Eubacterium ventriosum ATCC 27560]
MIFYNSILLLTNYKIIAVIVLCPFIFIYRFVLLPLYVFSIFFFFQCIMFQTIATKLNVT